MLQNAIKWQRKIFITAFKYTFYGSIFNLLVNCKWSSYSEWSECSATCGEANRTARRTIDHQALYGGKECKGEPTKYQPCELEPCIGSSNKKVIYRIDLCS